MTGLHPLLCSTAAFAALCLAMDQHHEAAFGLALSWRRRIGYRALALAGFAFSWLTVLARTDHGIAWAAWVAQLTLAALLVAVVATWWPRRVRVVLQGCAAAAVWVGLELLRKTQ